MENRGFRGIWIPSAIWFDERLSPLEKIVLMEIDSLDSTESGCYASNEYLASFCQCTARKISSTVSKLVQLGYIQVVSFDGRKRYLKSTLRVAKNSSQPGTNFHPAWKKIPPDRIDNKTNDIKKEKRKKAVIGGIEIERREYSPEELASLLTPLEDE